MEFILAFPIALAIVFAIAEFGILLANAMAVEMAAMEAAKAVANLEEHQLHAATPLAESRAKRVLETAGVRGTCSVNVRHNVTRGSQPVLHHDCPCGSPRNPLPYNSHIEAVECTVCVPMAHLTPDLLSFLGFSTSGRVVSASQTVPYLGDRHK